MSKICLAILLALGACTPPGTYVANVRYDGSGNLVEQKCQFDGRGRATNDCHDETIGQPPVSTPAAAE